ncbi:putative clathrin assembly protein At2g25430 [Arachis duranensis]|uniref:Clathrin assembly protein At2g25430 n=1 Tax=Arachis duranensis TaxID=130453 RepID=A0A6P5NBY3_ARADU|nr:putative clathrin assembly protein At2g25430 [Arachis duranensis]
MQRRFRQVCSALKEQSHVRYAKIASAGGYSNMNTMMIKATTPDDVPIQDKYIEYFLTLFSLSPSSCHSFAITFTRRFGTTRSWRVALKCLILLHRLLRSVPGNSPLSEQLLWIRSNGLISLHPCHFRDTCSSSSHSYTNFIRSYAHLLDVMLDSTDFEDQQQEQVLELLPQLQSVIDRAMDCFPVGLAAQSFMVQSAMKLIIRDNFVCYTRFRKEMAAVLDNLLQMPYRSCIAAFNIYKKASVQSNQLYEFHEWCRAKGLCGSYEYPLVDPIPHIQIKALETFLSGMWELTEDEEEEKPLIDVEDDQVSWETLLETSVTFPHQNDMMSSFFFSSGHGHEDEQAAASAYNPFYQPNEHCGSFPRNPSYPWGL